MSTQKNLIEIQKESFLELENQIQKQRRNEDPKISRYRKMYLQDVENYTSVSSKSELFDDIADANLVYCGDFHTLRRSQYTALKILRHLVEQKRKIFLGLELVPINVEHEANEFVCGKLSEKQFLEIVQYEKIWGFPWTNYQQLFELASKEQIEILALNTTGRKSTPLPERDETAAAKIVTTLQQYPDAVVFCLYGDLHIAQRHIPFKVESLLERKGMRKLKVVTIYQNSDEIYWKLLEQNLAHKVDVVKVRDDAYCILSSTPWIKWQSYQSWIDESCALLDEHEEDTFGYYQQLPDFFFELQGFAKKIFEFLNEPLPQFDDLQIQTALDTKVMEKIDQYFNSLEEAPKQSIQKILDAELIENRSVLIPDLSVIYLLDFSTNRAAEKSSQWVATKLAHKLRIYDKDFDQREVFYRLILWEAIAYFGSKINNPKRKCEQYEDLQNTLERFAQRRLSGTEKVEKVVAEMILRHHQYEEEKTQDDETIAPRKIFQLKPKYFFLCARAEGRILGDRLYSKVVSDLISLKLVKHLFTCLSSRDSIQKTYWEFSQEIKTQKKQTTPSKDELF